MDTKIICEEEARVEIGELHKSWLRAELEGRPHDLVAFCCVDIIIDPPGCSPVRGLPDAEAFLVANSASLEAVVIDHLEIDFVAGVAVKRARFSTRVRGADKPVHGRHLWIMRPRWKVAYLTWTIDASL